MRQENMAEAIKNERTSATSVGPFAVATFKKSLREWQADWQGQQGAAPAASVVVGKAKVRPRRRRRKAGRAG